MPACVHGKETFAPKSARLVLVFEAPEGEGEAYTLRVLAGHREDCERINDLKLHYAEVLHDLHGNIDLARALLREVLDTPVQYRPEAGTSRDDIETVRDWLPDDLRKRAEALLRSGR